MANEQSVSDITLKLRKLWKGTIFIGISGIYVLLLGMVVVYIGFKAALLTFFLISLAQLFRYVAGDVDRLGWVMDNKDVLGEKEESRKYQSKMLFLLFGLIQLANSAVISQVYVISTLFWALLTFCGLLAVELMFRKIRNLNREIDYALASYGIKDNNPISSGADRQHAFDSEDVGMSKDNIEEKLAKLKSMAEQGVISQVAYESVRDRELIQRVMEN